MKFNCRRFLRAVFHSLWTTFSGRAKGYNYACCQTMEWNVCREAPCIFMDILLPYSPHSDPNFFLAVSIYSSYRRAHEYPVKRNGSSTTRHKDFYL
ncbi:hypothetical protein NPIL_498691 [Nephila pilipes]|uniref:Secreted protein n=1 Tax=Nephila pilipes TaxID=299642 RepID=A0A8X6KR23_NEPPI|nr:hypothetical protein NPIL_498691 [Nephila pilipes]